MFKLYQKYLSVCYPGQIQKYNPETSSGQGAIASKILPVICQYMHNDQLLFNNKIAHQG